jgi:hypothetical protein
MADDPVESVEVGQIAEMRRLRTGYDRPYWRLLPSLSWLGK